jgi:hypothetical protein
MAGSAVSLQCLARSRTRQVPCSMRGKEGGQAGRARSTNRALPHLISQNLSNAIGPADLDMSAWDAVMSGVCVSAAFAFVVAALFHVSQSCCLPACPLWFL